MNFIFVSLVFLLSLPVHANQSLLRAIQNKVSLEEVKFIFENDPTVKINFQDEYKNTALIYGVETHNHQVIDYLVSKGAKFSIKNEMNCRAFDVGTAATIEFFLDHYKNVLVNNKKCELNRRMAIRLTSYPRTLDKLLKAGYDDIDYQEAGRWDDQGNALMYAVYLNQLESLQVLFKHKANLNLKSSSGYSALLMALDDFFCAKAKCIDIALALIQAGADVNQPSRSREYPLRKAKKQAAILSDYRAVEALIAAGAKEY